MDGTAAGCLLRLPVLVEKERESEPEVLDKQGAGRFASERRISLARRAR